MNRKLAIYYGTLLLCENLSRASGELQETNDRLVYRFDYFRHSETS